MSVRNIRVSAAAREQLIRLKTRTGIGQWNVLCRWAFCVSIAESTEPTPIEIVTDSNVEMTWEVFAGAWADVYAAVLRRRCLQAGLGDSPEVLRSQFSLHLHRGIGYLATPGKVTSATDLVRLVE